MRISPSGVPASKIDDVGISVAANDLMTSQEILSKELHISVRKITTAEEKKAASREQYKRRQLRQKEDIRAYEELCVNARKLQSERGNLEKIDISSILSLMNNSILPIVVPSVTTMTASAVGVPSPEADKGGVYTSTKKMVVVAAEVVVAAAAGAEERKKAARRERYKRRQMQLKEDIRAYEETCVYVRKLQSESTSQQPIDNNSILQIALPTELQWSENYLQLEREKLQLESFQREKGRQREKSNEQKKLENELRQLKRISDKDKKEKKRIREYHDLDVDSPFHSSLSQYTPILHIQGKSSEGNAGIRKKAPRAVVGSKETLQNKDVTSQTEREQRKVEKHRQEEKKIRTYHALDVESLYFNSTTTSYEHQYTTPIKSTAANNQIKTSPQQKNNEKKVSFNLTCGDEEDDGISSTKIEGRHHKQIDNDVYEGEEESAIMDSLENCSKKRKAEQKAQKERERQKKATQKGKIPAYEEMCVNARLQQSKIESGKLQPEPQLIDLTSSKIAPNETTTASWNDRTTTVDLTTGSITIEDVLEGPETDEIIIFKYNIPMTRKHLCTLKDRTWLNDEIINFYVGLLTDRDEELNNHSRQDPSLPSNYQKSYFATTFFFEKLLAQGIYTYGNVARWTRGVDVFSLKQLLFPININNTHWTQLTIYMGLKEIHYYDSMSGDGRLYLKAAMQWLQDESLQKRGLTLNATNEWRLIQKRTHVPQQNNGFDCGLFVIMCTRAIAYDQSLTTYHQSDMPIYRKMVGRHIIRGSLKEPSDGSFPYFFDLRHILQGSLLDSNNQSVPFMFHLSSEHQQTSAQSQHATTSLNITTSFFSRKTITSLQRQMTYTHVQPQRCQQYSTNSAAATVEEVYSVDSEKDDDDDEPTEKEEIKTNLPTNTNTTSSQRQMTYTTYVPPQRRQFSTNPEAAATVQEVDSVDSEEEDKNEKQAREGIEHNITNTSLQLQLSHPLNVKPHRINFPTKSAAEAVAAIKVEDSEDSEEDIDGMPTEDNTKHSRAIPYASEYGTKTLPSVRRTNHHSEKEKKGGNSNSDTECSSETCESENCQLDAENNSTIKRREKSNEALKRNNNARRNTYWIKNEKKRKSNKYYKVALLDLNDSNISSIPTGEDHQVR